MMSAVFLCWIKPNGNVAAVPNPSLAFFHYLFGACVWCKRFADNNITDPLTTTNRWEREALCMALMSPRGFRTALQSRFEQHSAFCLQPFSLLLKRCWNSFGGEIKGKKCTTAMLRWETGSTHSDSNVIYMKVFAQILQSRMPCNGLWPPICRSCLSLTCQGGPQPHCSSNRGSSSWMLAAAQTQDDEKIIWNHFILRVCCDSIFAGKLQTQISV